jgi:hypothetical protein
VPKTKVTLPTKPVSLRRAAEARPGEPVDVPSLLIVTGLGFAIACFAIAMIPATAVPWRPAKIFVSERQLNLTALGFALLMATAFTFFLTRGP